MILLGLVLTGTGVFLPRTLPKAHASFWSVSQEPKQDFSITLSGFEPEKQVSYSIFLEQHDTIAGKASTDARGFLNIPIPLNVQKTTASLGTPLLCELQIAQHDTPITLTLKLDTQTGTFSTEGKGLEAYKTIHIDSAGTHLETRSDWAGFFEETMPASSENRQDSKVQYKIAFYDGAHIQSDAALNENPAIITFVGTVADIPKLKKNLKDNMINPLMEMAEQLSATGMQSLQIFGSFLDAKEQLEAQRDLQRLKAEAVKDYHPSDQMCRFGSFSRSLATTEAKANMDQMVLNDILMETYTNKQNSSTGQNASGDTDHKLSQYRSTYCDPADNNASLDSLCKHKDSKGKDKVGAEDKNRTNKDIDFIRTVQNPYTLDINFTDQTMTNEEEDIIALAKSIYWSDSLKVFPKTDQNNEKSDYMKARRLIALNGLAHTSFTTLVSMKAKAPPKKAKGDPGWMYMKAMMREFGMKDDDIVEMIGENPSYYAQMDILTKKMYQNSDFYTNLYDKPANIERVMASMEAISLMQMRDHYAAGLRREMLTSGLIEQSLVTQAEKHQGISNDTE